jgi:hypothetical protein
MSLLDTIVQANAVVCVARYMEITQPLQFSLNSLHQV